MPSENKKENVMLTGQTAYFKKSGSMVNHGKIDIVDQESAVVYEMGYIEEGSTLGKAVLETSADYESTVNSMEVYLEDDFIAEADTYLVKANAEKIATEIAPRALAIQTHLDNIHEYTDLKYLNTTKDIFDFKLPVKLKPNFVLQIKSNIRNLPQAYSILDSAAIKIGQNESGKFFINDIELPNLTRTTLGLLEIVQQDGVLLMKNDDTIIFTCDALFDYEIDAVVDLSLASRVCYVQVYGNEGIEYHYVSKINSETSQYGMHNIIGGDWYPTETQVKMYREYESSNIWSGALDLGYCPGPNTGIEITYKQYSSQSSSTNTFRNIIGCYSGYSKANTLSFGILVGNGSRVYGCRNNNIASWTDSGVISANSDVSTVTLNKHGDGRLKSTGAMTFNVAVSGTATIQNKGRATLWLSGTNDLGRYIPCDGIITNTQIPMKSDIYIYGVKIYEGTELVRDYVVAADLDNSNIKGMWDKVENKMYRAIRCSFNLRDEIV